MNHLVEMNAVACLRNTCKVQEFTIIDDASIHYSSIREGRYHPECFCSTNKQLTAMKNAGLQLEPCLASADIATFAPSAGSRPGS